MEKHYTNYQGKEFPGTFNQKQMVWRTANNSGPVQDGYYVWNVLEVIGHEGPIPSYFTECRDGSLIHIQCFSYWTIEKAGEALYEAAFDEYQEVYVISGKPDLTAQEYREWFECS